VTEKPAPKAAAKRLQKRGPTGERANSPTPTEEKSERKYTGKGIKVGIIDTGIDYTHPALGGGLGPGFRVTLMHGFGKAVPCKGEDKDGHGTGVAGIVGGNSDDFEGVAPDVTFGAYNVFGCQKGVSTATTDVLQALNQAAKDGMDIVNLSLGSEGWKDSPLSIAASELGSRGVIVVAATGNEGEGGLFTANQPGTGENVISVAACVKDSFAESSSSLVTLQSAAVTANPLNKVAIDTSIPMTIISDIDDESEGCDEKSIPANLKGKYVLLRSGACTGEQKVQGLLKNGAAGIIFYTDKLKMLEMGLDASKYKIPIMSLTLAEGGPLRRKIHGGKNSLYGAKCKSMSQTSSWGPDPDFHLNPDVTAWVSFFSVLLHSNYAHDSFP
jgi:hypothetical protein